MAKPESSPAATVFRLEKPGEIACLQVLPTDLQAANLKSTLKAARSGRFEHFPTV